MSPVEIVRCIYDAYEEGDVRTPAQYFDANVQGYISDYVPWGGKLNGMRDVAAGLATLRQYVANSFETSEIIDAGDDVVAVGDTVGFVHQTGQAFRIRTVHIWHFVNGKIVRFENYLDKEMVSVLLRVA